MPIPIIAYQKNKKYYRYGNFTDLKITLNTAWKLKKRNRKINYKITSERINGRIYYTLWVTNYIRW